MKKILLLQCFFLAAMWAAVAQTFNRVGQPITVKGDMIIVGNSILNVGNIRPANTSFNNPNYANNSTRMDYTDVDTDKATFNSSSANVKNPSPNTSCLKVKQAYLYWTAVYSKERLANQTNPKLEKTKFKNVKFRVSDTSPYRDIVGTAVYDSDAEISTPGWGDWNAQRGYVYRADVTQYLTGIAGNYTVANIQAPYGHDTNGPGYSAGWALVIIYEDLSQPSRNISLFDGFSVVAVNGVSPVINISGFKTVPTGPVRAKLGFAALEGESGLDGDVIGMKNTLNTWTILSTPGRAANNFFNSSITNENGVNIDRNPASTNLLGFDAGIMDLPNNSKNLLPNNATSTSISVGTVNDSYYPFMFAFSVEVVEPHIVMEKRVYKGSQDITDNKGGVKVNLGDQLIYKIKFKNIGNDDAKDLVIVDKLPKGLDFVKTSIQPSNFPAGTHVDYTYSADGGTLTLTVDKNLVTANSTTQEFSFGVEVVNDCKLWRNPCANRIKNEVVATYNGVENPKTTPITSKSFKSEFTSCFGGDEGTSDFVVNVDFSKCVYKEQVTLCKLTTTLKAADGFTSYQWATVSGTETVNATTQNLVVSAPGVYRVTKSKTGCATMYEEFTVIPNIYKANHPVESMITSKQISGETYVCPSTGEKYPQVYLCGKNSTLNMRISISNATNFLWEKKVNCANTIPDNCPPDLTSYGCSWTTIGNTNGTVTNQSFTEAGDYRLTVTYDSECMFSYYFRVTKNELDPKVEPLHIVCTTPGKITVKDVPSTGYQFALMKGAATVTNWQTANTFTVTTAGSYNVLIKQTVTNTAVVPCIFEISNIVINKKNPSLVVTTTDMACDTNKGNMRIQINDPPYNPYTIVVRENNQSGAVLYRFTSSGTTTYYDIKLNNYFNHGTYFVVVENGYGCTITKGGVKINKIPELKATASVLKPITPCASGIIRITASGGKKGVSYDFEHNGIHNNSTNDYFDLDVATPGTYNFVVTDANGCTARTSITITQLTAPTATANYQITQCGQQIQIYFTEPQSAHSYTYQYALVGKTPQGTRTITGLTANTTYTPTVLYTINGQTCTLTLPAITIPDLTATDNLIASAGVEKLVECGTGANAGKALVRFANVQGGVPPYEYSFDGGVNFGTATQTWLVPGTYQLAVRDNYGCRRDNITVKVADKIAEPTFSTTLTYNCEGKATVKVNSSKGSTYTYTYQVDGGTPQNSNTFTNLAVGTHTIVIQYADANPPTKNVLFLEDFGVGTTHVKTPYINDSYVFEPQDGSTILYNRAGVGRANPHGPTVNDGEYTVVDKMRPNLWGDDPVDHTGKTNGRILFVNIGSSAGVAGILYQRKMTDIIPNKPIQFSIALYNLIRGDGHTTAANDPNIKLELYRTEADALAQTNILASNNIGFIPKHANVNDWKEYKVQLNSGNNTTLYAVVRSFSDVIGGNDLAIDDIYLYQEPEACPSTYTTTVVVKDNQAFGVQTNTQKVTNAKCYGGTGTYQIAVKNPQNTTYYVQKDNVGAFVPVTDAVYKWENIPVGAHTVKFRGDLNNPNCEFTRTFTITQPAVLTLSLDTSRSDRFLACNPATARVTMTATGGTLPYSYALYKGTVTITAAQTSPQFTLTQTGTYRVIVTDANGCQQNNNFTIINAPVLTLTGTTDITNNNYCMSSATAGKVQVKVTDSQNVGTSPYTFFHNGAKVASQTANAYTYTNLQVGVHTFTVIDKYGCVASYTTEIKRMITADGASGVAVVAKDITCHSGNAARGQLNFKVKDGYAPYTYIVKNVANTTVQGAQAVPANKIATYLTATPGAYTIEVTDSKGCKVSGTATLTAAVKPTAVVSTTAVVCYGANDGTISLTISGGTAPYKISIDGGTQQNVTGNQHRFTGVMGGNHTVRITDARECYDDITVTVAAPALPLKAFVDLAKLIRCGDTDGDPAHKDKAKVRFVNVTGGYGDYRYKFGGNFDIYSEGWLPVGTHTVTVRDKAGCEYDVTVTVPKRIDPPTGTTYTITSYDCDGKGTIRISGLPSTYSYTYTIGGKTATGTTATITGLPPGSHTLTIKYTDAQPAASSVLLKEDFGVGPENQTLPQVAAGATTTYPKAPDTPGRCGKTPPSQQDIYFITNGEKVIESLCWGNYAIAPFYTTPLDGMIPAGQVPKDPSNSNPKARYFMIDLNATGEIFRKQIKDIDVTRKIQVQVKFYNLIPSGTNKILPTLRIKLMNGSTQVYATPQFQIPEGAKWDTYSFTIDPMGQSQLDFVIYSDKAGAMGNDLAMDDILVYQVPESCAQTLTKTVVIPSGQEFKASVLSQTNVTCKGSLTGKVTFRVENLRGGTYNVYIGGSTKATGATSTTFEVTGLEAKTHTVTFRYTPAVVGGKTCNIDVPVTITEPAELTLTATVVEPAMCSNAQFAKVRVTATGGTGAYIYTYLVGGVTKTTNNTTGLFTGVATGTPSFMVKDVNGCSKQIDLTNFIPTPKTVSFTLEATECYAGDNQGVIKVKIADGNGGYTVSLNGSAAVSPTTDSVTHSFTGLRQGSYTVTVKDQYGCSAQRAIDIYPSLTVKVNVTDQGACTQAKLEVLTSGGANAKEYRFYKAGSTPPPYGTTNTYTPARFSTASETWVIQVRSGFCEKTYTETLKNVGVATYTQQVVQPECQGTATGKIILSNLDGGKPFKIGVQRPGAVGTQTQTGVSGSYTIANAVAGVYTITIQDVFGCSSVRTITIVDKPELMGNFAVASTATCTAALFPLTLTMSSTTFNTYISGTPLRDIYYSINGGAYQQLTTPQAVITPGFAPGTEIRVKFKTVAQGAGPTGVAICSSAESTYKVPHMLSNVTVQTNLGNFANGCNGVNGFTATVTIPSGEGEAPYQFSKDGGLSWVPALSATQSNTAVFTGLEVGRTHTFMVKDNKGCTAAYTGDVYSGTTLGLQVGLVATPNCAAGTGGGLRVELKRNTTYASPGSHFDWEIVPPVPGGSGTNVMMIDAGAATTLITLTNIVPVGTYYVKVTEKNGSSCVWYSRDAEVKQLDPITGTVSVSSNITCDTAGVVEVLNVQGGGGQYTYTLTPVGPTTFVTPIATANNRVQVLRDNISNPNVNTLRYPAAPVTITVKVKVTDQYGCDIDLGNHNLVVQPKPAIYTVTYTGCSNGNFALVVTPVAKTSASAAPTTELGDYSFSKDGGLSWQSSNVFTSLSAGTYVAVVRENATGCEETYTVTVHNPLEASARVSKVIGCGTNGEITIRVDKGSGSYTYNITPPSGTPYTGSTFLPVTGSTASEAVQPIGNTPGTYTVTIKDNGQLHCSPTIVVVSVASPSYPEIKVSTQSVTCFGSTDGFMNIVELGSGNYIYTSIAGPLGAVTAPRWNLGTRSAKDLEAGVYTITVKNNDSGCSTTTVVRVGTPPALTLSATLIQVDQFACGNNGQTKQAKIVVPPTAIAGGTGTRTIEFEDAYGNKVYSNTYTLGIAEGSVVTITLRDASGCYTSVTKTIVPYERIDVANLQVVSATTCQVATVTLTMTKDGVLPFGAGVIYYYEGATAPTVAIGTAPWQTGNTFTVTPNATHKFWIGNKNTGCIVSYDYISPDPNTFRIVDVQPRNIACSLTDGSATFTLEGLDSLHTYQVSVTPSGGTINPSPMFAGTNNKFNISGLAAGIYTVTVKDQQTLCEQVQRFSIESPTQTLTATTSVRSITCASGNNDGEIRIENVSGGWGGYQYHIGTSVTPTTAAGAWTTTTYKSGLASGTYYVWVRDNLRKDCPLLVASITMNNPTPISGTLTVTQENCVAGTGEISVATITGGDGVNYTYQLIKDGVKEGIPQSTRTFTGLGAGNYEVVVSDSWGCPATLTLATGKLHEPISNVQVQLVKEVTCASPTGATLSVTHQGGSNSITYTLTPQGGGTTTVSTTPVFTGVPAGNYIVGVKDNNTVCDTETTTIEVTPALPVAFSYTQTNVGCHGGDNGTIEITIPGTQTQTDYVIQIEGAGGFTTRTETVNTTPKDFSILGLKAGVYTVTVRSSRACEQPQTITITEPAQLVVSSTTVTTHFSCDANNQVRQAIVQAIAAGGATGTYTYNFVVFDGQNTNTTGYTNSSVVSISSNGSHTQTVVVYVRDANGCEANNVNSPTVIPPLKRITAIKAQQTRPIDCQGPEAVDFTIEGGSNQGYIVRVTGGTTTLSIYTVTSGVSVVSVTFDTPGYYEVTVTDSATGCYDSVNYGIANYDNISISAAQTKPVTCAAGNDGELTLSMRGYAGNYTFRVVNEYGVQVVSSTAGRNDTSDPRTQPIGGLSAGKYYVEVTETQYPYCTKTATLATLSGPSSALTASTTITNQIKCGSGQTGSFMVTAAGGWGNYEYRLTVGMPTPAAHSVYGNYSSTSVFEALVSETYTVWVKDQNGCETSVTQVMSPPAPIAATVTKTDVKCFSERDGSITVSNTTGGSGNYTYELWEVGGAQIYGAQTSTTFTGLDAREYKVKIVDGWNCDLTIPVTIDEPQEIKVTASIVSPTTCLQTQATIQVTATGGSGSYQYRQGTSGSFTANNLFTLPPGTYEFYVQDANGCPSAASNKVEVVAVQPVSLTVNTADAFVKCNGEATARITFSATGGIGGYQYELYKKTSTVAMTISATQINATDWAFSGLATGTYYIKVKSGVDCLYTSADIVIDQANPILVTSAVTNITCKGEKDGKITVTATGGTGTIVYAISPRFDRVVESGVFEKLAPGEYVVRIQDANGCHRDEIFKITEPDLIRVRIDRQTDEVCYGANDGTISVTITGGTQSYSTSIDGGANWHQGKTLYTGLASGTYTIKVKDAMSCTTESDPITIKGGVDLQATATVEYSCPSNSVNNAVRVRVNTDVAAQTTFALDGVVQASNYFTSVTAGVHTITVRHQGGCVQTLTVNVDNYAPLSKTVSVTHITCYGEIDGKVQINVTGGTGSYTYSITPQAGTFSGTNMFVNLPKGQYTIQVKDAVIGCEVSERITIEEPDVLKLGVVKTVTETCYQQSDGQLEFMIQGGRAPYSYELKDSQGNVIDTRTGIATGTTVSRTNMAPGTYSLVFRDGNCSQTQNITIAAAPSLQATATVGFECSTVSTTSTNPYIQITLARDNSDGLISSQTLSYSINGEPIKPFVGYVDGNLQVLRTRNIENNGLYTVTIFYRPLGMTSLCSSTLAGTVSVTRYPGLEILDKTDPREINKVRVKVVGGNPREGDTPYSITFNGSYENGESEYMLKPTDPTSRVVNGRIFKLVVVEAIDANNCSSTLTIEKEYMKSVPPDFFTPNGDGQNDGWDPDIYRSYPNLTVDIYDRYGRYIKTLRSGQVWDGRYEGKEMPSGDYWYILRTHEDEDQQEYMGHFTLYR
ncbi:T9SS type B sorting domain-containing protein [Capnocytophaga leadbetteri]